MEAKLMVCGRKKCVFRKWNYFGCFVHKWFHNHVISIFTESVDPLHAQLFFFFF